MRAGKEGEAVEAPKVIEEGRGRCPSRAVLEDGATILELESAVAAGGHGHAAAAAAAAAAGWPPRAATGEDKPTMKGKIWSRS